MKSTMQEAPLLISGILRHGESIYADKKIFTVTPEGVEEATFFQISKRAEQLAAALVQARRRPGDRVATFMWNNQAHMEAYLAVPVHGRGPAHPQHPALPRAARLHHQPRRGPGRSSSTPRSRRLLAKVRDQIPTVETIIVHGDEPTGVLGETLDYETLVAAERPGFDWPDLDERDGGDHVLHVGHDRQPQGRRLLAPLDLAALAGLDDGQLDRALRARPLPLDRADVPRQRLGRRSYTAFFARGRADHAPDVPPGRADHQDDSRTAPDDLARRAHACGTTCCASPRPTPDVGPLEPARDSRRRRGGAPLHDRGVPRPLRRRRDPGLGDDRDESARRRSRSPRRARRASTRSSTA